MKGTSARDTEAPMENDRSAPGDHNASSKNDMSDTNDASAIPLTAVDRQPTEAARAQEAQPEALRASGLPQQAQVSDRKNHFARPAMRLVDFLDMWDMFCLLLSHLPLASCAALRCAYKCYQNCSLIDILGDRLSLTSSVSFNTHNEHGTVDMRLTPVLKSKVPFWKMSFDVRATTQSTAKSYNYRLSTELGSFSKMGTLMWNPSNMIMALAMEKLFNECIDDPNGYSFVDNVKNNDFSRYLHLWASRWDLCTNPFYAQDILETKVLDFTCSKYPKTHFLESGEIFFKLRTPPFWSDFRYQDRYYLKGDNSAFAISAKPSLGRLDGVKPCHKHKLSPLDHILSTLKLSKDMTKTLCSFGFENVLGSAVDQDKVDKVVLDIKDFIKENADNIPMSYYDVIGPQMHLQDLLGSKEFDRYHIFD